MARRGIVVTLAVVLASALAVSAAEARVGRRVNVDFQEDGTGFQPNGFRSADSRFVAFSDSLGADLFIDNFAFQGRGQALAVFYDDESYLIMDLAYPATSISLWFGNDDPCCANPGDQAVLTLSSGGTQVGQVSVELNLNDVMDQQISFSGASFDQATFLYDVSTFGLTEIVDEIQMRLV
jgi:hypothetical protein